MSKATVTNPAHLDIVRRPVVTEKATNASQFNQVIFKVDTKANKQEIKEAVEAVFGVKVKRVNTINMQGKIKRFRGLPGQRNAFKKAIITLEAGQTLDVMAGV